MEEVANQWGQSFLKPVIGTDEVTGREAVFLFAGGADLVRLADDVARHLGVLMVERARSPRFNGEIQVVWMREKLPSVLEPGQLDYLREVVCDSILKQNLHTQRDIKLRFQVGSD